MRTCILVHFGITGDIAVCLTSCNIVVCMHTVHRFLDLYCQHFGQSMGLIFLIKFHNFDVSSSILS